MHRGVQLSRVCICRTQTFYKRGLKRVERDLIAVAQALIAAAAAAADAASCNFQLGTQL